MPQRLDIKPIISTNTELSCSIVLGQASHILYKSATQKHMYLLHSQHNSCIFCPTKPNFPQKKKKVKDSACSLQCTAGQANDMWKTDSTTCKVVK